MQTKKFISFLSEKDNSTITFISEANRGAIASQEAIKTHSNARHLATVVCPKAFLTEDGFLLFQDSPTSYSDGDLTFDATKDGVPLDDDGEPLKGEMVDGLSDQYKVRFLDSIAQYMDLDAIKSAD